MPNWTDKLRVSLLAWLAFVVTFVLTAAIVLIWPKLRGADPTDSAGVMASIASGVLYTGVFLGLVARDGVKRYLGAKDLSSRSVPKSGCAVLALPASAIAFFCTCAPLGLVSMAEQSVRPSEKNWSTEIGIAAWMIGILSAAALIIANRRARRETE